MPYGGFPLSDRLVIDVGQMRAQFFHLRFRNGEAKFALCIRKLHPKPAPGGKPRICGEQALHALGGVTGTQRAFVAVLHDSLPLAKDDRIAVRAYRNIGDGGSNGVFHKKDVFLRGGRQVAEAAHLADIAAPAG